MYSIPKQHIGDLLNMATNRFCVGPPDYVIKGRLLVSSPRNPQHRANTTTRTKVIPCTHHCETNGDTEDFEEVSVQSSDWDGYLPCG